MKTTIFEIKNILDEINNSLDIAKEQMNEFRDGAIKNSQMKHRGGKASKHSNKHP